MKKAYSFLLVLILAVSLFSSYAFAQSGKHDEIDLSDFSTEELIELYDDVREEIMNRLSLNEDTIIGRATYVVGKDIKPGVYVFTVAETDMDENGEPSNAIVLRDEDGDYLTNANLLEVGTKLVYVLADGQKLTIYGCTCYVSSAVPFWAP